MNLQKQYHIIWFENGDLYTLAQGKTRITISEDEVFSDGYPVAYSTADIDEAMETGQRFAITPGKLTELLGIL